MMKVIMPAKDIPIGSTITRITGEKQYILQDSIVIHYRMDPQTIKADGQSRFIIPLHDGGSSQINVVDPDKELVWHVEPEKLIDYIDLNLTDEE